MARLHGRGFMDEASWTRLHGWHLRDRRR
jgi:hypothetical protein